MAATIDMTTMFKDFMGAVPFDTNVFKDAIKNSASLSEQFAGVALTAAGKNADVWTKWTNDTLTEISEMSNAKNDPADYAKSMTDFASVQAEVAAENIAAFAEIAKKAQLDAVNLMMTAGKGVGEEATSAVKKATTDAASTAKKAAAK
jgi:hypothetical protein